MIGMKFQILEKWVMLEVTPPLKHLFRDRWDLTPKLILRVQCIQEMREYMQQNTPFLFYEDVTGALHWLAQAFGFREYGARKVGHDGRVHQAAMILDDCLIMLGCPNPEDQKQKRLGYLTQNLYVAVHDLIKHYEQARKAGATILREPENMAYGERRYVAMDPAGHHWYFAQRVSPPPTSGLERAPD